MRGGVAEAGYHQVIEQCGAVVDRLTAWARNGLEAFHGLSLLQLCLVGALGLGLGYRALGLGFQFIRRAALTALLAIAANDRGAACPSGNILCCWLAAPDLCVVLQIDPRR